MAAPFFFSSLSLVAGCKPSGGSSVDGGVSETHLTSALTDAAATDARAIEQDAAPDDTAIPAATSDELTQRMHHLLEAIEHDNPDLATDVLFPRDAYLAARDGSDPGKAWDLKVLAPFRKQVHAIYKRTKGIDGAQFASFELGHSLVQITPKHRDWKKPLWRVKHSRLAVMVDGRTQRVDIGEMTSWQGAWYVSKLR